MVLKLNPGGWLGFGRHLRTSGAACAIANHCYPLLNSYVEPLLLSVITLRDKVLQKERLEWAKPQALKTTSRSKLANETTHGKETCAGTLGFE